jgi:hypothetical protein
MPSFVFGRFCFEDFRLACLFIPVASTTAGQEPTPGHRSVARFPSSRLWASADAGRLGTDGFFDIRYVRYSRRVHDESRGQYDAFSEDYQWLYSDSGLCGKLALEENDDVLTEAGLKAHILDCSCGEDFWALHRRRKWHG